jgi:hypothetical protein
MISRIVFNIHDILTTLLYLVELCAFLRLETHSAPVGALLRLMAFHFKAVGAKRSDHIAWHSYCRLLIPDAVLAVSRTRS